MEKTHDSALTILKQIRSAGFTAFFAGGAVRDKLLGRTPKDYDIATNALPEQIEDLFPKTVAVGKAFGVIMVVQNGIETEVATFREDAGYQDGRRPDSVHFCGAEEDAKRRDFTINGMFYDPATDNVIDYVGGKEDLEKKLIRAIGDPDRRFAEDHLRMLRAVRFAHTLGFEMDPATRAAIKAHAPDLAKISIERIENEFSRTLVESIRPGDAVEDLVELGLMEHIIPEVLVLIGQEQPPEFHPEGDVFVHTCLMLNLMKDHGTGAPACGKSVGANAGSTKKTPSLESPFQPVENGTSKRRRKLTRWQQDNRIYFVTFRINDSLPQTKIKNSDTFEQKNSLLNNGYGECLLRTPDCRSIMEEALTKENGVQYELLSYVIMPNHIHLLVKPSDQCELSSILQSWKSISARRINKRLNRHGAFWMDESFDHIVRSPEHLQKFIDYIRSNPLKAHLLEKEYSLFVAQEPADALHNMIQTPSPTDKWQTRSSAPPKNISNFGKILAYSVLLHDIAKPATAFMGEDRIRFHGHETAGARMAEQILRRLKLPTKEIKQIVIAIAGHMRFKDVQKMNRSTLRKLMGAETFDLELELHRVDCTGSHCMLDNYDFLLEQAAEMQDEPVLPDRWISGKDLCEFGIEPGPRMGELLKLAYDAQLEGRFKTREQLFDWLKQTL